MYLDCEQCDMHLLLYELKWKRGTKCDFSIPSKLEPK